MEFKEKYTDDKESTDKKIISSEAFAIGDIIQELINKIEHIRMSLI